MLSCHTKAPCGVGVVTASAAKMIGFYFNISGYVLVKIVPINGFVCAEVTAYWVMKIVIRCLTALSLQAFNYAEYLPHFGLVKSLG